MRDLEPPFTRLRAEHRVLRAVLAAAEEGAPRRAQRLAGYVATLDEHASFEDDLLFPFLRRRVPGLAGAIAHAEEEHDYIRWHLPRLLKALHAGRTYEGPVIAALRHHFAEEEVDIVGPALVAGIAATPRGRPGRLLALHDALIGSAA